MFRILSVASFIKPFYLLFLKLEVIANEKKKIKKKYLELNLFTIFINRVVSNSMIKSFILLFIRIGWGCMFLSLLLQLTSTPLKMEYNL